MPKQWPPYAQHKTSGHWLGYSFSPDYSDRPGRWSACGGWLTLQTTTQPGYQAFLAWLSLGPRRVQQGQLLSQCYRLFGWSSPSFMWYADQLLRGGYVHCQRLLLAFFGTWT